MNRAILLAAAGLFSAAIVGTGCQKHHSSSMSSSSSSSSSSSRMGSARGESMQATGQPGTGAKHGTGTSAAGEMTGNTTTATPAAAKTSASASLKDAGSPGQTASNEGQGPGGIDQQKTVTASASPAAANASATVSTPAPGTVVGAGPSGIDQTDVAAQPAAAADKKDKDAEHHADAWAMVKPASGAPKDMQVSGKVMFAKAEHGVKVMVDLKGMAPGSKHGFHIHEKSDLSGPDLKTAGPHFNPSGKKHGGPDGDERHGGDLGNITADDKGNVKTEIMAHGVTIDGEKDGIIGRSILVHEKADDMKTDPAGDSGARIAGGVIEKAGSKKESASAGNSEKDAQAASAKETVAEPAPELNK